MSRSIMRLGPLRHWIPFLRPVWPYIALGVGLQGIAQGALLAAPWIAGRITDDLLQPQTDSIPWQTLTLFLSLLLIRNLLSFFATCLTGTAHENLLARLQEKIHAHLLSLPLGFFHQHSRRDLSVLLHHEAAHVAGFLALTLPPLLPHTLLLLAITGILTALAPLPGLALALLLPTGYGISRWFGGKLHRLADQILTSYDEALACARDNLARIQEIKAFHREDFENVRFRDCLQQVFQRSRRYVIGQALFTLAIQSAIAATLVAAVSWSALETVNGRLNTAQQFSFLMYALLLFYPLNSLSGIYGKLQQASAAARRLNAILETPAERHQGYRLRHRDAEGDILFNRVSFAYPGQAPILNDLTLPIEAGTTVALIGPNGSGKSTLMALLLRFYDPDSGIITINGRNLAACSPASVRQQIAYAGQHTRLFHDTLFANILYGNPEADRRQLEAACEVAQLDALIASLPKGGETEIGPDGVRLSGGQRQRVALARALIKDAPILILDEATSQFDPKGEHRFLQAAREHFAKKTVILISHRPHSLEVADRVFQMGKP
ncbi:ABC transporter ATP-binding protein [Methylomarinovum caldicuralii]|nr:ABC transporter ATP-binding protein [Methylomarinovum caldicuralii]